MERKEICDFWVGNFDNSGDYFDFLGENSEFFQDKDCDKQYISTFAKSQDEHWIDHDFMESGFENGQGSFIEKFKKYSYSDQWLTMLSDKVDETDIRDINTIIFITKGHIRNPASVFDPTFTLRYIGQIEYNI